MGTLHIEAVNLELLEEQRKALNDLLDDMVAANQENTFFWIEALEGVCAMLDAWSDNRHLKEE